MSDLGIGRIEPKCNTMCITIHELPSENKNCYILVMFLLFSTDTSCPHPKSPPCRTAVLLQREKKLCAATVVSLSREEGAGEGEGEDTPSIVSSLYKGAESEDCTCLLDL